MNLRRLVNKLLARENQKSTVSKWKLAASRVIEVVKTDKRKQDMGDLKGQYREYKLNVVGKWAKFSTKLI